MSGRSKPDPWAGNRHAASNQTFDQSGLGDDWAAGSSTPHTTQSHTLDEQEGWADAPGSSSAQAGRSEWSGIGRGATGSPDGFTQAPVVFLWISGAAALVALVLAAVPGGLGLWVPAWLLAAIVGFGGALLFTQRDAAAQASPRYLHVPIVRWLYRTAIIIALLAVIATAVRIALVFGRMG